MNARGPNGPVGYRRVYVGVSPWVVCAEVLVAKFSPESECCVKGCRGSK